MAPAPRPSAEHLSFLARARVDVRRWGLLPLLRGAEARAPNLPRIGRSRTPAQNVADLTQEPALGFARSTLASIETHGERARIAGYWLGLVGPMGALPTHLSEYAAHEARYAKARPFGRFLDMLAGRMLQFFYRAWADSQPAAMADRPEDDRFAGYLGALSGAAEGVGADAAFPARARIHYAALFASTRSATGIEDALAHLLRQPVRLLEYRPRWSEIEDADRTRPGIAYATLGRDAILGTRVRTASDAFRVVVDASSFRDYQSLLPGGRRFAIAGEALEAFTPGHLEWDIAVGIAERQAPPARLDGRSRLGWSSWLGRERTQTMRRDAHLRRAAARFGRGMKAA